MHTHGKGERMTEEGMLSIVWRGPSWQVRYASSHPYGVDRPPYLCSDEGALVALLHHCGIDAWASITASATFGHSASPDNVTCGHGIALL